MRSWSISEARARISEVFDAALTDGPQRIERRDRDAVVVIPEAIWDTIEGNYADIADLVLGAPLEEGDLLPRRPARVLALDD
ncbi:MAG: type II toxin-antitoxin system Phd/YefM family antitoxin [Mesorhizobium sp.]|nr:type II toxin-antitoxin system Phd/YefM family antitoxin [Mesorhizobium sp.]